MEDIRAQVLLHRLGETGNIMAYTTYGPSGQGSTEEQARLMAESVLVNYLDRYIGEAVPLPSPEKRLNTADEVAQYFSKNLPAGAMVVEDLTVVVAPEARAGGIMPVVVFEFYRVQN